MMNSKTYDGLVSFTREELAEECKRRGLICNVEKAGKHEMLGRILENNLSHQPSGKDAENVSTTDLLRLMHRMLEQQTSGSNVNRLISTPELSHTLPKFGGTDEETLSEWLSSVEAMRLQYQWDDPTVLAIAQNKLRGPAKDWNESVGRRLLTWGEWTTEVKKQFGYDVTVLTWSKRCENRIQGPGEKTSDYMHAKMKLIEKCPVVLRERDKVDYLVLGIRERGISASLLAHFKSVNCDCYTLIGLARELEPHTEENTGRENDSAYAYPNRPLASKFPPKGTERVSVESEKWQRRAVTGNAKTLRCYRCNATGHMSYDHDDPMRARNLPPVINPPPNVKRYDHRAEREKKPLGSCAVVSREEFTSKHPTRPVLIGKIGEDHVVDVLIDTGADITILRSAEAEKLRLPLRKWTRDVMDVVGAELTPKGSVKITVTIGNTSATVEAAVVDHVPYAVLVGGDWREAARSAVSIGPGRRVILEPKENLEMTMATLFITKDSLTTPVFEDKGVTDSEDKHSTDALDVCDIPDSRQVEESIWVNNLKDSDIIRLQGLMITRIPNTTQERQNSDVLDYIRDLEGKVTNDATPAQVQELRDILIENVELFAKGKLDIGFCPKTEHVIELTDDIPVKVRSYRYSWKDRNFIREEISNWMAMGLVRKSQSSYASPVFVVEQPYHPSTPRRLVVDYRKLNGKTVKRVYSMPRIDDTVDRVGKGTYFSTMDVKRGFLNIKIRDQDQHKTAFLTPDGLFEFVRMPFGPTGAPATWQEVMDEAFQDLKWEDVVAVFYDDTCVYTQTIDEHLVALNGALQTLRKYGLKVDIEKCQFMQREIKFLGYIVSKEGKRPDPERISAVDSYPDTLRTVQDVRRFLGFASYFRKFIRGFSAISRPLNLLLKKGRSTNGTGKSHYNPKASIEDDWTSEHTDALQVLKKKLKTPPILGHFNPEKETHVYVDASANFLGAFITQKENQKETVIEYASRATTDLESRSHSNVLECLAVHWALTDKFRIYVVGLPIIHVWTDNWSMSYLTETRQLNRKFARMALDLQELPIRIHHRSGKTNVVADALSRPPDQKETACLILIAENSRLALAQKSDPDVKDILEVLHDSDIASRRAEKIRQEFFISDVGILCRRDSDSRGNSTVKIVIPSTVQNEVLVRFHDQLGHMDKERTKAHILRRYWWAGLARDVKDYVEGCTICQRMNSRTSRPVGFLHPRPVPSEPFMTISLDHIGPLPETNRGNKFIIVCIDHSTRMILGRAVPSTSSAHIIDFLNDRVLNPMGVPLTVISDQGSGFMSKAMTSFLANAGIEQINSCPYFPQANGLVERAVGIVKNVLRKYSFENHSGWDENLGRVIAYINTSKQGSTKVSPFFLLYGYQPRVVGEIQFGTVVEEVSRLQQLEHLNEIRTEARNNLEKALAGQKRRYDEGRIPANLNVGDYVWLEAQSSLALDPKRKDEIFRITKTMPSDICEIEAVDGSLIRTVHSTQLKKSKNNSELHESSLENLHSECPQEPPPIRQDEETNSSSHVEPVPKCTSSGRAVRPPKWQEDYLTANLDELF